MKTQCPLFFLLSLLPFFVAAQCTVSAGSDTTFCSPNTTADRFFLGTQVVVQNGTAPYTYEWSGSYQDPIFGLRTATHYLDDTTSANPEIVAFSWEYADTSRLNGLPFYLKVTDNMGQTCTDTIAISFTQWYFNLDDCRLDVPLATPVGLRHNIGGGIPPYQFAWSPSAGLNDSTLGFPSAIPDSSMVYWVTVTDQAGCSVQSNCTVWITSSGIEDIKKSTPFSILPNPVKTSGMILLENLKFQGLQAEIIDLQGKVIFNESFTSNRMEFSAENLATGMYLCRIRDKDGIVASKQLVLIGE